MSCGICASEFTEKTKRPIDCPYCNQASCLACLKQCTLLWASQPKCAHCNKAFTSDFIDSVFAKGFRRGPLRLEAIKNLQEQEMSLLPATMIQLEDHLRRQEFYSYYTEYKNLLVVAMRNYSEPLDVQRIADVHAKVLKTNVSLEKKTRTIKTSKCPGTGCNGYMQHGTACKLCGTKACRACNATLKKSDAAPHVADDAAMDVDAEGHVCNEDDIKSWAAIQDSTVACPKCSARIQKISGCNQMWCTVKDCNTAFDWATGKIINGPLHNPHYHEYLRQNPNPAVLAAQAAPDIACQGPYEVMSNVRVNAVYQHFEPLLRHAKFKPGTIDLVSIKSDDPSEFDSEASALEYYAYWTNQYLRAMTEIFDYFHEPEAYGPQSYVKLRMDYLQGHITKAKWASKLSHKETLRIKQSKLLQLRQMYQRTAADIFARLYSDSHKAQALKNELKILVDQSAGHSGSHSAVHGQYAYKAGIGSGYTQVPLSVLSILRNDQSSAKSAALACLEALKDFVMAHDTLRHYYAQHMSMILSDYSDSTMKVLIKQNVLAWQYVLI